MQIEGVLDQAIEFTHAFVCIAPDTFYTVSVVFVRGELIGPVGAPAMLVKTDFNQTVVTSLAIGMDERSWINVTPNNPLQCGLVAQSKAHRMAAQPVQAFEVQIYPVGDQQRTRGQCHLIQNHYILHLTGRQADEHQTREVISHREVPDSFVGLVHIDQTLEVTLRYLSQKLHKDYLAPVHMPASSPMRWSDNAATGDISKLNRRNPQFLAIPCLT